MNKKESLYVCVCVSILKKKCSVHRDALGYSVPCQIWKYGDYMVDVSPFNSQQLLKVFVYKFSSQI